MRHWGALLFVAFAAPAPARCGLPRCGRISGHHFMPRRVPGVLCMPSYRFKFYDPNSRSEKLGAAVLADDNEAVAFAQRVMRELVRSDETLYATWMTKITEKERTVAS